MTVAAANSDRTAATAWWIWLLAQAALLAAYAARFKLTGGYPEPIEATADLGVGISQVVFAVLLAPALTAEWKGLVRVGIAGLPMAVLASHVAGRSAGEFAGLTTVVATWILLIHRTAIIYAVRLALVFVTIAGPILFYVAVEYGDRPTNLHHWPWQLSPVLGICATRLHRAVWQAVAIPTFAILAVEAARWMIKRQRSLYCKA